MVDDLREYLKQPAVEGLEPAAYGAYVRLLLLLEQGNTFGVVTAKPAYLRRATAVEAADAHKIFGEIKQTGLVDYSNDDVTGLVTVVHREMDKVRIKREKTAERVARFRARKLAAQGATVIVTPSQQAIFDHWNSYGGRHKEGNGQVHWIAHKRIIKPMAAAMGQALRDHSLEDVTVAIDNYATVLLGAKYGWTYAWTLTAFLTRRAGTTAKDPRKWEAYFHPENFSPVQWPRAELTTEQKARAQIEEVSNGTD